MARCLTFMEAESVSTMARWMCREALQPRVAGKHLWEPVPGRRQTLFFICWRKIRVGQRRTSMRSPASARREQAHLVEGDRLRALYEAYRSAVPVSAAATSVFPRNADLLLLITRLQWDPSGELEVPGNLALWQEIFAHQERGRRVHASLRHVHPGSPEQLLEALVAYY